MEYVVPENIHTPSPWNFRNFLTWLGTPWKLIVTSKILLPYTIMRKLIVCDKEPEKNFFFHVSTVSNKLSILPFKGLLQLGMLNVISIIYD